MGQLTRGLSKWLLYTIGHRAHHKYHEDMTRRDKHHATALQQLADENIKFSMQVRGVLPCLVLPRRALWIVRALWAAPPVWAPCRCQSGHLIRNGECSMHSE